MPPPQPGGNIPPRTALSKNPELADWLITRALERRGRGGNIQARELLPLAMLDDACEHAAHEAAMKLLG